MPADLASPPPPAAGAGTTREVAHVAMWTLLGLMALGLVLVPVFRPSIVWTSLFFGWSNVMVAYMAYRLVAELRRRAPDMPRAAPAIVAPPVVSYRYGEQVEAPRRERRNGIGIAAPQRVEFAPQRE